MVSAEGHRSVNHAPPLPPRAEAAPRAQRQTRDAQELIHVEVEVSLKEARPVHPQAEIGPVDQHCVLLHLSCSSLHVLNDKQATGGPAMIAGEADKVWRCGALLHVRSGVRFARGAGHDHSRVGACHVTQETRL